MTDVEQRLADAFAARAATIHDDAQRSWSEVAEQAALPVDRRRTRGRRWLIPALAAVCVVAVAVAAAAIATGGHGRKLTPPATSIVVPPTPSAVSSSPAPESSARSIPVRPTASATPLQTIQLTGTVSGTDYKVAIWADQRDSTCVGHSYGAAVTAYIAAHPCSSLHRLLITTTTVNGKQVAASIIFATIPGTVDAPYAAASGLAQLLTQNGTGSLNDLLREGRTFPGGTTIPSDEVFKVYNQDAGVMITDLWYIGGPQPGPDETLPDLAQDLVLGLNNA